MLKSSDRSMEEAACFCGSALVTAPLMLARDGLTAHTFAYRVCSACGAERITPRPARSSIGSYYPIDYASHRVRGDTLAERLKHVISKAYLVPHASKIMRLLVRPFRGYTVFAFDAVEPRCVFEFGSASGNDLMMFKAAGWEVSGCEPSESACARAATRGIYLQNVPAEAASVEPQSVSCVVINNVLEHVHDPAVVLTKAYEALVPGGSLVIVVPNHNGWSARWFSTAWPGYDAPRHLWGFTPASLSGLLCRTGFMKPRIHHRFQGLWAWSSSLDGRHGAVPVSPWRVRWASQLATLLFPVGVIGAAVGSGDFLTLVARKP